jgi:hypothetical protein
MAEMMSKELISIVKGIKQTTVHILPKMVFEDNNDGFPEQSESFTKDSQRLKIDLKAKQSNCKCLKIRIGLREDSRNNERNNNWAVETIVGSCPEVYELRLKLDLNWFSALSHKYKKRLYLCFWRLR